MLIIIPWPPKELSPNARVHWAVKRNHGKNYKEACYVLTRSAMIREKSYKFERPTLKMKFYPKDNRRRDLDNALAMCKYGLDGIAQALGVDDSEFSLGLDMMQENLNKIEVEVC